MKNREIKFRVWDKEEKLMRTVMKLDWYCNSGCTNLRPSHIAGIWEDKTNGKIADKFELMQYTGLKDKDKNEIYEGDILITGKDETMKVFFNSSTGSFDVEFLGGDCERLIGEDGWKQDLKQYKYKIIGNIYENAVLWAVEKKLLK